MGAGVGIGMGLQFLGGFFGQKGARAAAARAREIARINSEALLDQAEDAADRGSEDLYNFRWSARQVQEAAKVKVHGAMLNSNFGSQAAVAAQTAGMIDADARHLAEQTADEIETLVFNANIALLGGEAQAEALEDAGLAQLLGGSTAAVGSLAAYDTASRSKLSDGTGSTGDRGFLGQTPRRTKANLPRYSV